MKVVTYNIQFGLGKDGRNDLKRIASTVDGADIIALQEVERNWAHSDHVDQPARLASHLPDYYWVYGPYFDVDASQISSDGSIKNARRQFGNMILSKTPILSTRLFPLPKSVSVGPRSMALGLQEAVIKPSYSEALRLYNTHLSAKSSADRVSQIKHMRSVISAAPTEGGAWTGQSPDPLWKEDKNAPPMPDAFMLLGDFNHGPSAPEYQQLLLPDSDGNSLIDCWTLTGNDLSAGVTYQPTENPENGDRIDFAFVDQHLKNRAMKASIDTAAQGSDHQPYWIEVDNA